MPAIGATLRKWTLCLLLCSVPTPAYTQATNETAIVDHGATALSSTTTQNDPSAVSSPTPNAHTYSNSEATCPFRTINYITHTLPQQCAKATWTAPGEAGTINGTIIEAGATLSPQPAIPKQGKEAEHVGQEVKANSPSVETLLAEEKASVESTHGDGTTSAETEQELETDSPLDNANFLSFEEWKTRNLAQVGQSPENVGQGRAASADQPARRRPVNVNALDSLGDEAEIELDFAGFGTPEGENIVKNSRASSPDAIAATEDEKKPAPSSWALSKDAGKTCKERFNYASFDCAATVLKTNKQAKSATSVLVENKDSYMLNECSADNKFLIVELCDDILVDTIVLANYEFFSSMFRHFRISVSDRYPVKMERWRTLATFEARNSRDIQPFLITEPQIWARYLRIEFLSQYGNEFYCPLSLLRVHGTTMMEQFRREEEEARGVDDDVDLEVDQTDVVKSAVDSGPVPPDQVPRQPAKEDDNVSKDLKGVMVTPSIDPSQATSISSAGEKLMDTHQPPAAAVSPISSGGVGTSDKGLSTTIISSAVSTILGADDTPSSKTIMQHNQSAAVTASDKATDAPTPIQVPTGNTTTAASSIDTVKNGSVSSPAVNDTASTSPSASASKATNNSTVVSAPSQSQGRASPTMPNPAAPSTQESFFKSIHKRLQYLEANSTLSLQYIEEQSRILRDAFVKVEKRQLAKTEKFLDHLNSTVMLELKSFRTMYDQLWQSTVIELESMKERQKSEMGEIGARLSLMADELVWQKRMAVVQSTLLLLCLGLVLFVRSGTLGSAADVPIVQQLGSKYNSFFESSPPRSPPESGIARRRRTFRNMWRSDTSAGLSDHQSDGQNVPSDIELDGVSPVQIEHSPPTPTTPSALAESDLRNGIGPRTEHIDAATPDDTTSPDDQAKRLEVLETQSGPATPKGTRDSRPSWEEVDRAMDQLKAEENGQDQSSSRSAKRDREKKKKRSPLRRAHSSFDGAGDNSPNDDSGSEMFLG